MYSEAFKRFLYNNAAIGYKIGKFAAERPITTRAVCDGVPTTFVLR